MRDGPARTFCQICRAECGMIVLYSSMNFAISRLTVANESRLYLNKYECFSFRQNTSIMEFE